MTTPPTLGRGAGHGKNKSKNAVLNMTYVLKCINIFSGHRVGGAKRERFYVG